MELSDTILATLGGTSFESRFRDVEALYAKIDSAQSNMRSDFPASKTLSCPPGCGTCCESFIPDVLPLEAEYIAAYLIATSRRANTPLQCADKKGDGKQACPFYNAEEPSAHCGIYPARALICRLFGFTPSLNRDNKPVLALCKHMPSTLADGARKISEVDLDRGAETDSKPGVATMSDFAQALIALSPDEAGDRRLLTEALPSALARIGLLLSLASGNGGEPNESDPEPRAA